MLDPLAPLHDGDNPAVDRAVPTHTPIVSGSSIKTRSSAGSPVQRIPLNWASVVGLHCRNRTLWSGSKNSAGTDEGGE